MEAYSPLFREATDFLIAIAEPVSRPKYIHEYKLTSTSLYSAASIELKKDDIIKILDKFCKNLKVPEDVEECIAMHTSRYGKAKLILQQNKYYIEAENAIMEQIKLIPMVKAAMKKASDKVKKAEEEKKMQ